MPDVTVRTLLKAPPPTGRVQSPAARKSFWRRLWLRAQREVRKLFPAWLFFFLSFSLLRLTQNAVLEEFGVRVLPPSKVLIGSLLVSKALLTVDSFRLFARFKDRPVIVSALGMTFVYTLIVFVFQYSEMLFANRREGFSAGTLEFTRSLASLRFWVIQIWLVVLLFSFSLTRSLARKMGHRRFRRVFFGG